MKQKTLTKTLTKAQISGKIQNNDVPKYLTFQTYQYGRGVAQLGSALGSGPRGRRFNSGLPDHLLINELLGRWVIRLLGDWVIRSASCKETGSDE